MSRKGRPVSKQSLSRTVSRPSSLSTDIHTCRCTTTPVCRRKRRTKAQIAADAAAEAEAASTPGSSRQTSTPRSRTSTSSPEAYISSWQMRPQTSSEASCADPRWPPHETRQQQQEPVLAGDSSGMTILPAPRVDFPLSYSAPLSMIPTWSATLSYPLDPALTETLCEGLSPMATELRDSLRSADVHAPPLRTAYMSSSIHGHPIVQASKWHESLRRAGWRVESLSSNLQVAALCGIAIGATFTSDPTILKGFHTGVPIEKAVYGTDLREFGKQRQEIVRSLSKGAMDAAYEARVMFQPTIENATSCYMLDVLMRLSKPLPLLLLSVLNGLFSSLFSCAAEDSPARRTSVHRPFAKAYASHVRGLFAAGGDAQGTALADNRTWAIHLAVDVCTEVSGDGHISMCVRGSRYPEPTRRRERACLTPE